MAVAEPPTAPDAGAGTTDASTLPESWIYEFIKWDDEHRDLFAAKVTEYLAGGRTHWWAERLAFCDASDVVNATPPDVPTDLTTLELQVAELGQHVLVDGRFPESMRPEKGFGPPSHSRRINRFEVPAGWTRDCWIERLRYMTEVACMRTVPLRCERGQTDWTPFEGRQTHDFAKNADASKSGMQKNPAGTPRPAGTGDVK